jgi:uncharacterized tellurite resistance protein B-like protein|nr:hypothetical protein [Kofleriaceae bacterium]
MDVPPDRIREIVRATYSGKLSPVEAEAIVALGQLAVDADGREDPDEISMFFAFGQAVLELAGIKRTPEPSIPDDDELARMAELAKQLDSDGARDLAYAMAYVLTVADIDIAPAEDVFIERLQEALGMTDDRARELGSSIAEAVTPTA